MTKTTAELIKEIRLNSNLTQRQFAKRFYITEKTVSNYETGKRTPDLDFIFRVCNEFNLSLDFFMNRQNKESKPNDLIVSEKGGKFAIFDRAQSIYLTQHCYDRIYLSACGHHIVLKGHKVQEKGGESRFKLDYSAIMDNAGKVKEYSDLEFGFNGCFEWGVCPAYSKSSGKVHLVNGNGEILSEGFSRIQRVGLDNNFGLYYGLEWKAENKKGEKVLSKRQLIYKTGKLVDLEFDDINAYVGDLRIEKLSNLDNAIENIKKYGANILSFIPDEIYKDGYNYILLLNAVNEHAKHEENYSEQLMFAVSLLSKKTEHFMEKKFGKLAKTECMSFAQPAIFDLDSINGIEAGFIRKQIENLLKKVR